MDERVNPVEMARGKLEEALTKAGQSKIIDKEQVKAIREAADLELREDHECEIVGYWTDFLNNPEPHPDFAVSVVLDQIEKRKDHFREMGWIK